MPLDEVLEERIDFLKELFKTHAGDKQLHFTIYQPKEKVKLSMPSRSQKVNISKELLQELDREQVGWRLN